jgi:hypothetical protein
MMAAVAVAGIGRSMKPRRDENKIAFVRVLDFVRGGIGSLRAKLTSGSSGTQGTRPRRRVSTS